MNKITAVEAVPAFTLAQDAPIVAQASLLASCRHWYWLTWVVAAVALPFVFAYRAGKPDCQARVSDTGYVPKSVNFLGGRTGAVAHSGILATVHGQAALSLLVVLVFGVMFWSQHRAAQATTVRDIVDKNLQPEDFQGAVILVCGDNAPLFVSGSRHRETRQGWYL